jgi:hypothetical protein
MSRCCHSDEMFAYRRSHWNLSDVSLVERLILVTAAFHVTIITVVERFDILTAIVARIFSLWAIAPCNPYINRRFGVKYQFHLQGRKSAKTII